MPQLKRRSFLTRLTWPLLLGASALLAACASAPQAPAPAAPPVIVFVHGNGDSAAVWLTTLWRFESNGWPRERLHAIEMPDTLARDDDTLPQPGRSSAADHARFLQAEVDAVLARTGATRVVLVGNSRGGLAIRNLVRNFGAAAKVEAAVLGGTPNHGVWALPGFRPNSEFNGSGPFLSALNAPAGPEGLEVTPGVRWLTLRSDSNDKFAQPDGVWIGARGTATNIGADGPALKGATNLVLPGRDHREVSTSAEAFARSFEFIAGRAPATTGVQPEASAVLDGIVSGNGPAGPDNRPLAGASVEVYAVDPRSGERQGPALHRRSVGVDGRWGPFSTDPSAALEFVISAPGYAIKHLYRSPFPRSSNVVHLRAERLGEADRSAAAVLSLVRPRGYFGVPRDRIELDGRRPPPDIPPGVAGVAVSRLRLDTAGRAVAAEFNGERLVGRAWPTAENRLVVLELQD
jgi:pimeloyl-ACP methyl ester carboxylesterase